MAYKFETLDVWQAALGYGHAVEQIAQALPKHERFNLTDQVRRAATSITLNIAEGSTGQSDAEQNRFLGYARRSLVKTVACIHIIQRRGNLHDPEPCATPTNSPSVCSNSSPRSVGTSARLSARPH